jgi:hypothetical protein
MARRRSRRTGQGMTLYLEPKRSGYEVAIPIFAKWAANCRKTATIFDAAQGTT